MCPWQILPAAAVQSAYPAFRRLTRQREILGRCGQPLVLSGHSAKAFRALYPSSLAPTKGNRPRSGGRGKPFEGIRGCRAAYLQGDIPPRPATVFLRRACLPIPKLLGSEGSNEVRVDGVSGPALRMEMNSPVFIRAVRGTIAP